MPSNQDEIRRLEHLRRSISERMRQRVAAQQSDQLRLESINGELEQLQIETNDHIQQRSFRS